MVDGVIIPVSNCSCITVDFWAKTDRNVLAAFLTHAHADHVQGLNDSWNGKTPRGSLALPRPYHSKVDCPSAVSCSPPCAEQKPIYCSHATREILCGRFPGLTPAMRVLEEECTTLLKLASPVGAVDVHVTAYNANHCLVSSGSVLWLLQ